MKTKLVIEVVTPIDATKEFRNRHNAAEVDTDVTVPVSVKIGEKLGTMKISRRYEWKKAKPVYDFEFSPNLQKMVDAAEELKTVKIDDSAPVADYERARAIAQVEEDTQTARKKMDEWLNHPVRAFQAFADTTSHKFVIDPSFTMDNFLKDKDYEARTYLKVTYGSREWKYKVGYDSYRTDNTGKAGKLTLRANSTKLDETSYEESKFDGKSKYSKKPGEIIRYMEEDIEAMKTKLDDKIKEQEKELVRIAQINAQWNVEGAALEDIEDDGFSIVMDKKKSKSSWDTTAKKVDIKVNEGKKPTYEISGIEAKFTRAQVEAIIEIVKKAQVTTY